MHRHGRFDMKVKGIVIAGMCAVALVAARAASAPAAETVKIGYVNMQKALENSSAGQAATKKLNELAEKYKVDLQTARDKAQALKNEIDKQAMLLNDKVRREKEDEIRRMERDLSHQVENVQAELKAKESEFSEAIARELMKIVDEIGKAEAYTVILEKRASGVLYAPVSIDLTDRVIKAYDTLKQ
jgi:outer membrane protein